MDDRQESGYSGSDSYRYVDPILSDSGTELLVISPYIGMGYAKRLVKLGRRKRIRVITSAYSKSVSDHIAHHSRYLLYGYAKAAALFAAAGIVSAYFSFYLIAAFAAAGFGIIALIALIVYKLFRNSDIEVRISYDRFVHEKAYLSGATAVVGSANLTYSGMHRNVERVEVITDPSRIARLRAHFFDLWRTCR